MARFPYCSLSALLAVLLVVLSAKSNGTVVSAFLTRSRFCAAPISNVCTLHVKPNNDFRSRIWYVNGYKTILSSKLNDDDNDKYLGALDRAVQTGDTRKLDVHQTFWVERCRELVEYEREHGNCDVLQPKNRREKGTQLQNWVRNQRTQYRFYQEDKEPCSMTEERIAILEGMGFSWEINGWSGEQAGWKMRYEQLEQYKEKYGNCNVPKKWKENPKLGSWVDVQRREYRNLKEGRPSDMTAERIEMLEKLEFEWYVRGPLLVVDWELRYEELKKYKAVYGNCNVPQKWKENPQLGRWVNTQRVQYRLLKEGKESDMMAERIDLLEKLDFDWYVIGPNVDWELRYEELKRYKKQYGDCNVPKGWKENPKLGKWVSRQRTQYRLLKEDKESDMTAERIEVLEKLEFDWYVNGPLVDWELRYEELKKYKERYGDCNVPQNWKENPKLGKWVSRQRTQYRLLKEGKKSTMTAERIDMLEKLEFIWNFRRRRRREIKT